MQTIDYEKHGLNAVTGAIKYIQAGGEEEFNEHCGDCSVEMFGEDEQGREASGDVSVYSIIDAAGDAIEDLKRQLAAERERAEALINVMKDAAESIDNGESGHAWKELLEAVSADEIA